MANRTCAFCASDISHTHANSRYCGPRCRDAKKWLERPRAACSVCGSATGYPVTAAPESPTCRACIEGAEWSHGTRDGYRKNACRCAECKAWNAAQFREYKAARREQGNPLPRRGWIRQSLRLAIYDRDGWMCGICGEATDPGADANSDWAPSLDHVTPKSRGGSDAPENLRTAHRWCNTVRADERRYTDDDFRQPVAG